MESSVSERQRKWLYLLLGWALATVPVLYFHNGLVTEYYFSKAIWANVLIPLPLILYLFWALRSGTLVVPRARTMLPVALFCGWALLSLTWATNPYKGLELIGKVAVGPLAYLGLMAIVRTRDEVRGLLYLFLWAMAGVAIYGFFQYMEVFYLPKDQYGDPDPSTTIGLTNFVVEYMMLYILAGPILMVLDNRRWVRTLLGFGSGAIIVYVILSRNRAGMVSFMAELVMLLVILSYLLWRYRERFPISRRHVAAVAGLIVVGMGIVLGGTTVGQRVSNRFTDMFQPTRGERLEEIYSAEGAEALSREQVLEHLSAHYENPEGSLRASLKKDFLSEVSGGYRLNPEEAQKGALDRLLDRVRRDGSINFRLETWYQCVRFMFPANPLIGVGLANLEVEFPRYYTPFLERMTLNHNTRVVRAHNEYIQALIDLGVIGFVLLSWLVVQLGRTMVAGFRGCRDRRDYLMWLALNLGFFGFAVEAFFAFPMQVPTSSIYFFIGMALSEVFARQVTTERDEDATAAATSGVHGWWRVPLRSIPGQATAWLALIALVAVTIWGETFAYNALVGEVRNKEARVFKRYKRWDEAHTLLTEAIDHYPNMEGYYYDRAVVRMQQGRDREGLKDLRVTADLVPNYAMGRKQIGMLAARVGRTELAVEEFAKTMEIYKTERKELTELIATTALQGNRPELALPIVEETIEEHDIVTPWLLRTRASLLGMADRPREAVAAYEDLRQQGVWAPELQVEYGMALFEVGRVTEAESQLGEALNEKSDIAQGWLALGRAHAAQDQVASAKQAFRRAIALEPGLRSRIRQDKEVRRHPALAEWAKEL